jgi:hypothetical protein
MLDSPSEISTLVGTLKSKRSQQLERMESDYGLGTLEKFAIPKEEGEWENFTTNSPSVLANKVTHLLASARRRLWIPLSTEDEKERKIIAATERFANGYINLADEFSCAIPEGMVSQDAAAFFGYDTRGRQQGVDTGRCDVESAPYVLGIR